MNIDISCYLNLIQKNEKKGKKRDFILVFYLIKNASASEKDALAFKSHLSKFSKRIS
jgi:hypothetical protein